MKKRSAPRRPPPGRPPARRTGPHGLGGEQVEGRQAVRELLLVGRRRVRDVWLADDLDQAPILDDIVGLAAELRVTIRRVRRSQLEDAARSEAPQGVLAHAAPLVETDLDVLCRPRDGRPPFLLALDGVTDPQNLGALLRSAEAAGATGVVLPKRRAVHVTPTVAKAAAGAVEHLPMALVGGLPAALARVRELGLWTVGLDAGGDVSLFDLPLGPDPVALAAGAEGKGLGRLTKARCDLLVDIPLHGSIGSLNVATAGALGLFEIARRRK